MIGVTNNSPQQINAALIAMKNELKREIITETKIKQYESDVIDDTITSTTKTWSSEKIASEMYPLGFIYMQPYRTATPAQIGMQVPSGHAWVDISNEFSGDFFRVKNPRIHPKQPNVKAKVTAYNASTKVVTIESGVIQDDYVWNRDIIRYNGQCAWEVARTSETIGGVTYNKTFTLDRDLGIQVGGYISFSQGDAVQHHKHNNTVSASTTCGDAGGHNHTSNVGVALSNAVGSNSWCLVSRNKQYDGGLSGTSSWVNNHSHTVTVTPSITNADASAIDSNASNYLAVRDETRVQCSFMTVWQVQEV